MKVTEIRKSTKEKTKEVKAIKISKPDIKEESSILTDSVKIIIQSIFIVLNCFLGLAFLTAFVYCILNSYAISPPIFIYNLCIGIFSLCSIAIYVFTTYVPILKSKKWSKALGICMILTIVTVMIPYSLKLFLKNETNVLSDFSIIWMAFVFGAIIFFVFIDIIRSVHRETDKNLIFNYSTIIIALASLGVSIATLVITLK